MKASLQQILFWVTLFTCTNSFAQKEIFSRFNYTAPTGWTKTQTKQSVVFQHVNGSSYCQIYLWVMTDSKGTNEADFESDWKTLITKDIVVTKTPRIDKSTKNNWLVTSAVAEASFQNQPLQVMVITSTKDKLSYSISSNFNDKNYLEDIIDFVSGVEVIDDNSTNNLSNTGNHKTGITLASTNFDDGWFATLTESYVRIVKNGIEVRLYYPDEAVDKNRNRGDGTPFEYHYWDALVRPDFVSDQILQRPKEIGMDYILDANVKYKNQNGYASLKLYYQNGVCTPIVAFAPTRELIYQYFPDHDSFDNMLTYNKFAVTPADLVGKWGTSGAAVTNYYNSSTGTFAGSSLAATGDSFVFNNDGTYQSSHSYYTSSAGGGKQSFNGKYQANTWLVTMTNRFKNATDEFHCKFEAVKGGRILHLMDSKFTESRYMLVKEK